MRILIPVSDAAVSRRAVSFVAGRARLHPGRNTFEVFNVQQSVPVSFYSATALETMDRHYEEEAERVFESVRAPLEAAACHAGMVFAKARQAAPAIASEAEKFGADLIVMGKHGLHDAPQRPEGDRVAAEVIQKAQCPVLVLRRDALPEADGLRVGIAVDGSRFDYSSVSFVTRHLPLFGEGARFTLIHAVPEGLSEEEAARVRAEVCEPVAPLFERVGVPFETALPAGEPAEAVAAAVETLELDMLVLGAHGYGSIDDKALGTTAAKVAALTDLPLLVIR